MALHPASRSVYSINSVLVVTMVTTITSLACSTSSSDDHGGAQPAPPPAITIARPAEGESFEITATEVDVALAVAVTDFTLVPLRQEGDDMRKGQVRIFVDGNDCNDPGEPDEGEAPSPYNRILPNEHGASTIGLDYCVGGVAAIDGRSHKLRAELWHGDQSLLVSKEITFRTTFRQ